jgi:sulfatase modifying factor 1
MLSMCASCLAMAAEPALRLDLGGGVTLDLCKVPAGTFTQGSPAEEPGRGTDEDQRSVRISRDYYLGRTAVTRGQWERFVSETGFRSEAETGTSGGFGWDGAALVQRKQFTWRNPGFPQTADHPVCLVTFPDAQAFCAWLERKTQRKTNLPSEAQWEYACRAGTTTPWHAGAAPADGDRCAWHKGNAGNGTRPAGAKQPNSLGLVMGGNVAEWCLDWYAIYQPGEAVDPQWDNPPLSDKPRRVLRGGSWLRDAKNTRSAARYRADPRSRNADIGFRIVCAGELSAPPTKPVPVPEALRAEAELGAVPPPPAPASEHPAPMPRSRGFSFGSIVSGLCCLMIPLAIILVLIRLVARSQATSKNPLAARHEPSLVPSPVRTVDDGFWIDGNWPAGTALRLHYLLGGAATDQELIYRPGPDGHFVYTGSRPDAVSVATDGAADVLQPSRPSTVPPVLTTHRDDRDTGGSVPPIFPSAY